MLNYPQYHRKTYDELFEEALHLIPLYSKEWTNFNMSDPAITVLENFTAFQALQMEKMDTISEETDLALLSLAGFKPKKENRATVYVTSENCLSLFIPSIFPPLIFMLLEWGSLVMDQFLSLPF